MNKLFQVTLVSVLLESIPHLKYLQKRLVLVRNIFLLKVMIMMNLTIVKNLHLGICILGEIVFPPNTNRYLMNINYIMTSYHLLKKNMINSWNIFQISSTQQKVVLLALLKNDTKPMVNESISPSFLYPLTITIQISIMHLFQKLVVHRDSNPKLLNVLRFV